MTLHVALVLVLGFMLDTPARQALVESDRAVGIALVRRQLANTSYEWSSRLDAQSASTASAAATRGAGLPSLKQFSVEAAFTLPSAAAGSGATAGTGLPRAEGFTLDSQPSNRLAGGGIKTQVFGAEGLGSKFVYVFDRSASMEGFLGRPMQAARTELIGSLRDLASVHQFQIVFYNERTSVFHPFPQQPPRMMFGSDENKQLAEEYVRGMTPAGATRHMIALELALGMQPDVIFFLTDAAEPQLTATELDKIHRRNGGVTVINTIEFGSGPNPGRDNFLVRLARQNNGQHVYVDVSRLPNTGVVN